MTKLQKIDWQPSKFEKVGGQWRTSRKNVSIFSRMIGDLQVAQYQAAIEAHAFGALADLGCGAAPLTGVYKDIVDSYVWADWPNSLHQHVALDFEVDLNDPLPFDDQSFDTILLSDVLEHIVYPENLVAEIHRVLRPNGVAIIGVPFLYWLHETPHDHHRYTKYRLARFAEDNNMEVVSISETGGGFLVVSDMLIKLTWRRMLRWIAYLTHWFTTFIRKTSAFKRLNAAPTERMPLGYVAVFRKL